MTADEIFYLFGARNDMSTDPPQNGIPLHSVIETAMDSGSLVVVPKELLGSNSWQTVLVDKARRNLTAYEIGRERITPVYWRVSLFLFLPLSGSLLTFNQEYENKELSFPSSSRPARRYPYFRFIITYLHAKSAGNKEFTGSVGFQRSFWASGGQWLNGSTLMSLAQNISGVELPDTIKEDSFFDADIPEEEVELTSD